MFQILECAPHDLCFINYFLQKDLWLVGVVVLYGYCFAITTYDP